MNLTVFTTTRIGSAFAVLATLALTSPCRAESRAASATGPDEARNEDAAETPERARTRDLLKQGISAIDAGNYAGARETLLEAWKLQRSYDVAGALGQAELELGRYRDAAEHLDYSLRDFPPSESRELRTKVQEALANARRQVAALSITTAPSGAQISVDGAIVGRDPLENPVFLEPGAHRIEAQFEAYSPSGSTVQAVAGIEQDVQVTLMRAEPAPTETAGARETTQTRRTSRDYAPALIAGGAGVASAAVGIFALLAASSKASDRDDRLGQLPERNPCAPGTTHAAECDAIRSLDDDAHTFRTVAFVGFGVTAAAAVTTFLLWPREERHAGTGLVVLPIVGEREIALSAHARF